LPGKNKKAETFEGDRTLKAFKKYIKKNAAVMPLCPQCHASGRAFCCFTLTEAPVATERSQDAGAGVDIAGDLAAVCGPSYTLRLSSGHSHERPQSFALVACSSVHVRGSICACMRVCAYSWVYAGVDMCMRVIMRVGVPGIPWGALPARARAACQRSMRGVSRPPHA
jgi:hypothetical protein